MQAILDAAGFEAAGRAVAQSQTAVTRGLRAIPVSEHPVVVQWAERSSVVRQERFDLVPRQDLLVDRP
jgi:hypothetical protein